MLSAQVDLGRRSTQMAIKLDAVHFRTDRTRLNPGLGLT